MVDDGWGHPRQRPARRRRRRGRSAGPPKVSDELERWLNGDSRKTIGGLIELFEEKSFALLFVLLLGVPALPLPTGGVTHVFEILAIAAGRCSSSSDATKSGCRDAGASSRSRARNSRSSSKG